MRHKRIIVKYFFQQGPPSEQVFVAPPKRLYNEDSLNEIVEKAIDMLDKKFPTCNFRMVRVGRMNVNFVYAGLREDANAGHRNKF